MRVVTKGLRFPEGPVAMKDGSVAVVEVEGGRVSRVAPDGTISVISNCGGGPNGLAVGPDGALYLCNNGGSVWGEKWGMRLPVDVPPDYTGGSIGRIDVATGVCKTLYDSCDGRRLSAPNDIVFDSHGGFYFTDHGRTRKHSLDNGGIYYALPDGSKIVQVVYPFMTANGIGLSPDEKTLYVAQTETSRLWAFDIASPGKIEKHPFPSPNGGHVICGLPGYQRFDSLALEANGNICVATLMTGRVTVISPGGAVVRTVDTGDVYTTNICFGGPGLRQAFVTLSAGGTLMTMDWPEAGLPLAYSL